MTLEDILNDEMFTQTETEKSLFNTSKLPNRKLNDYSTRKSTKEELNFEVVKGMSLVSFNGKVNVNTYFVLNGVTGYLKSVELNRTSIVFENGTKSKMLYTSLISMMRKNGKLFL